MDEMSSNQHSSAYSSLANSTTEIHDIVKMEGESGGKVRNNKRATVDLQMRAITEDYNALLRRATEQIREAGGSVRLALRPFRNTLLVGIVSYCDCYKIESHFCHG